MGLAHKCKVLNISDVQLQSAFIFKEDFMRMLMNSMIIEPEC